MINKKEIKNVYAYNVKMEEIHISKAESGRKGYFCLGCQREMQAMISKTPNRISFFRHDPKAMKGQQKCSYSDETHRHKLAKEILLRIKRVKVPVLYKYPPKNINGIPNLISEAKYIEANDVSAELYFYENEIGKICWSKTIFTNENKYLLFKPDIVFFDKNKKPILLIEIIATHKITEKKQLDLKRLGINAIQITIPKDSPEIIEKTFEITNRTKWIYNYEQENTNYIPITDSNSERISSIDEDQRKLFEESYKCRAVQISNLIRTITRCLESEQYRTITGNINTELSRVERNTEDNRDFLEEQKEQDDRIRREIQERIYSIYCERRDTVEHKNRKLKEEENKFRKYYIEENSRFESKNSTFATKIEREILERHRKRRDSIKEQYNNLETRYNSKKREIDSITETEERTVRLLEEQINSIDDNVKRERGIVNGIKSETEKIIRTTTETEKNTSTEQEYGARLEEKYRQIRREIEEQFDNNRKDIELRIQNIRREFTIAVKTRNYSGNGFTTEFKKTIDDLQNIPDFVYAQENYRRYEKAWEFFQKASFKNWHD